VRSRIEANGKSDKLGPREQTREQLRQRIVVAARALLSETESIEFSMRALAIKAGVGHVTPYNIFGSKQAVLLAVLDADMVEFERAVQAGRALDPLIEIFEVVRLCAEFWFSDPVFYKTLYSELLDLRQARDQSLTTPLREEFWRRLTRAMAQNGNLQDFVAIEPLAMNFRRIALQAIRAWIARNLSQRQVEAELGYSVALALLGSVRSDLSGPVLEKLVGYQTVLVEIADKAKSQ
jgi:AcrR family transcriptional regulator